MIGVELQARPRHDESGDERTDLQEQAVQMAVQQTTSLDPVRQRAIALSGIFRRWSNCARR